MNRCPVCKEPSHESYVVFEYTQTKYSIARCNNCSCMFYINDFSFDFKNNLDHNKTLNVYLEKTCDIESLISIIYNLLSQWPGTIEKGLDIGCGTGIAMDFAQAFMNKKMTGFEPASVYCKSCEQLNHLNIISDFFSCERLSGEKQDFAICLQVLQMIDAPVTFLQEIYNSLSDDGLLLISTPDNNLLGNNQEDIFNNIPMLSPGVHKVIYNEASLTLALKSAGFSSNKTYRKGNTLFTIATKKPSLPDIELLQSNRSIVLQYYELKLRDFNPDSAFFRGIWYRYFRNKVDFSEYDDALEILKNAGWFEVWSESEIEDLATHENLFELNTFSDAIIYYYVGVVLLLHMNNYSFSEKFFLLSFLLCRKIIQIHPGMSDVERDILWLSKLNQVTAKIKSGHIKDAKVELITMLHADTINENMPFPSDEIKKIAAGMLKELN